MFCMRSGNVNLEKQGYMKTRQLYVCAPKPLTPRHAFFGGRTGHIMKHYKTKDRESIRYFDVCSLYPFINKFGQYFIGHPEVFAGIEGEDIVGKNNNNNISGINGVIKCLVLPPREIFHPVLPVKVNNSLLFPLCNKCAEDLQQT